jgi:hypothetical protein
LFCYLVDYFSQAWLEGKVHIIYASENKILSDIGEPWLVSREWFTGCDQGQVLLKDC